MADCIGDVIVKMKLVVGEEDPQWQYSNQPSIFIDSGTAPDYVRKFYELPDRLVEDVRASTNFSDTLAANIEDLLDQAAAYAALTR